MTSSPNPADGTPRRRYAALASAPAAAVVAGLAAEWLDFRALRAPILIMVVAAVLITGGALIGGRRDGGAFATITLVGVLAWTAVSAVFVAVHGTRGESFMFGEEYLDQQWMRAAGVIVAHGLLLGAPTGVAAALIVHGRALFALALRHPTRVEPDAT